MANINIEPQLWPALDALLNEASVNGAASRLNLSQPAVSHLLKKLRESIGDELLVRRGARMELTTRAKQLRPRVANLIRQMQQVLDNEPFDPSTCNRRFIMMMPDLVSALVMPKLLATLHASSPEVTIDLLPWNRPPGVDLSNEIDVIISYDAHRFDGFETAPLFTDRDVLAVRHGHPAADRLSERASFETAQHIAVRGRSETIDPVDAWLQRTGITRKTIVTVPSYLLALQLAGESDLVAFVPSRTAKQYADVFGLRIIAPPVPSDDDVQLINTPLTARSDEALQWFASCIHQVAGRPSSYSTCEL